MVNNNIRTIICDITGFVVKYSVEQIYKDNYYHLNVHSVSHMTNSEKCKLNLTSSERFIVCQMIESHHNIAIYNIYNTF